MRGTEAALAIKKVTIVSLSILCNKNQDQQCPVYSCEKGKCLHAQLQERKGEKMEGLLNIKQFLKKNKTKFYFILMSPHLSNMPLAI